jgi:hypothetical protein
MGTPKKLRYRMNAGRPDRITVTIDSTSSAWSPTDPIISSTTPTWYVSGDISPIPAPQTTLTPVFDLSNNTGLVTIKAVNISGLERYKSSWSEIYHAVDFTDATQLNELEVGQSYLTEIDVTQNTLLTRLVLFRNAISSIDLSNNGDNLTNLQLDYNNLTSSFNTQLTYLPNLTALLCNSNNIGNVDISNNPLLTNVNMSSNGQSGHKSYPNNSALEYLRMATNPSIGSVDLSNLVNLKLLHISWCGLSTLDLSNQPELYELKCTLNNLTSLDISANPKLNYLICSSNNMASAATDSIFNQLSTNVDAENINNGTLTITNNRTSASDAAYTNLSNRGWTITETT